MNDESSTLFLGDLSVFCTEKDIRKLFRPFGTIEAIRVKRGSSSKTNLSYGFIKFSNRESAETALQQVTGIMFLGRALRIGWAEGKNMPKATPAVTPESKPVETAQVHVSFISKQIDVLISEATLRVLFGLYGEVVDVALKKSQFDRNLRIQNGYGFVHYPLNPEGIQAAFNAVASLHQVTIDRVTYDCSVSHALEELIVPSPGLGNASSDSNSSAKVGPSSGDKAPSLSVNTNHTHPNSTKTSSASNSAATTPSSMPNGFGAMRVQQQPSQQSHSFHNAQHMQQQHHTNIPSPASASSSPSLTMRHSFDSATNSTSYGNHAMGSTQQYRPAPNRANHFTFDRSPELGGYLQPSPTAQQHHQMFNSSRYYDSSRIRAASGDSLTVPRVPSYYSNNSSSNFGSNGLHGSSMSPPPPPMTISTPNSIAFTERSRSVSMSADSVSSRENSFSFPSGATINSVMPNLRNGSTGHNAFMMNNNNNNTNNSTNGLDMFEGMPPASSALSLSSASLENMTVRYSADSRVSGYSNNFSPFSTPRLSLSMPNALLDTFTCDTMSDLLTPSSSTNGLSAGVDGRERNSLSSWQEQQQQQSHLPATHHSWATGREHSHMQMYHHQQHQQQQSSLYQQYPQSHHSSAFAQGESLNLFLSDDLALLSMKNETLSLCTATGTDSADRLSLSPISPLAGMEYTDSERMSETQL